MKLKEFISEKFNINAKSDEEGVYKFFFMQGETELSIGVDLELLANKENENLLVIECDDNNFMALKNKINGKELFAIDGTKINGAEFIDDEYEDIEGKLVKEYAMIFYSDSWIKRYLRIDFHPEIKVSLEIDYDKYDTDEEGIIIWE